MKRKNRVYKTKDNAFEYGFIAKEADMIGRMEPYFRPVWWAQYMGDGSQSFFNTKAECLAWIKDWYADGDISEVADDGLRWPKCGHGLK